MIPINLDIAISIFFSTIIILVISFWFRYTIDKNTKEKKSVYFTQCPYCSYVFFDFTDQKIKTCPRCQSYIEDQKGAQMERNIPKNGNSGSILVTVIMLILAMMSLAIGLLSVMGSQGLLSQNQVGRIKAEQFAKGLFWKFHHETNISGNPTAISSSVTLDGTTYSGTVTMGPAPANPGTNAVNSHVVY